MALANFASFNSKQDRPGSPLLCYDHKKNQNLNGDTIGKVIYNGLVGIAFETQEKNNLEVKKFINVQNHREWIEAVIYGKKQASGQKSLKIWSNGLNPGKMARGNSRTAATNISFVIWCNLIFMLSF